MTIEKQMPKKLKTKLLKNAKLNTQYGRDEEVEK